MSLDTWLGFLAAAAVLLAIPGPTILLVVGQALGGGRRAALPLVAGVAAGDFTAMTLSLVGLGAVMAASSLAFSILKWAGAAYLVWLGVRLWRAPVGPDDAPPLAPRTAFREAWLVTALNPKAIAFFIAFVPQFIVPSSPFMPQAAILVASFVSLAALNALAYALLAARLAGTLRRPTLRRACHRLGAGMLVVAGLATAMMRRA